MKYITCASILCLFSCVSVLTQTTAYPCQKINIRAPEVVRPNETFRATASFENEKQPSASKFNWLIIKYNETSKINEVERKREEGIIEINSWKANESGSIVLVAEALDPDCLQAAVRTVIVMQNIGSPLVLDEYSVLSWTAEKARLDNIVSQMQRMSLDTELLIFDASRKLSLAKRKNRLAKLLNYLSTVRQFPKSRITFLISGSEKVGTRFEPVPREFASEYPCDHCLVIKGEDFAKLETLFCAGQTSLN